MVPMKEPFEKTRFVGRPSTQGKAVSAGFSQVRPSVVVARQMYVPE